MKKLNNLNFNLQSILKNPQSDWGKIVRSSKGNIRTAFRELDVDWKKYNTNDYLFTHDSIVCSVETEENGYWITKPCEELVNANGNAWKNEVLLQCFRTFIGGDNFQEHIQIPALSKGKILDAIIRPVVHHSKHGDANIYVVDILVATDRRHRELVERIESGQLKTLSMGAVCEVCQCSICGKIIKDDDKNCEHLDNYIGSYYKCEDGKKRVVAELCGALDENGNYIENSCNFIEASWVEHPAFEGAVVNAFIETEEEKIAREKSQKELEDLFNGDLFERLKVADTDSKIALNILKLYKEADKYLNIAKKIAKESFEDKKNKIDD